MVYLVVTVDAAAQMAMDLPEVVEGEHRAVEPGPSAARRRVGAAVQQGGHPALR